MTITMIDGLWLRFGVSAFGVIAAGVFIGRVSGEIGDRLHLGRAWAGAVLLSFATTLPELVSTITVALRGHAAMALGGILGSIVFNLLILVFVDCFDPEPIYHRVSMNHVATGLLGCALLGVTIVGVVTHVAGVERLRLGHVGGTSLALLALYGFGQYALFRLARNNSRRGEGETAMQVVTGLNRWPLRHVLMSYAALASVILVSAYHLGVSAEGLAAHYGLGATFAGATLLGVVTSLPEITNALACARQREYDLALGNVLGANTFVFLVLALADVCYLKEPLLYRVAHSEALSSVAMAGLAIVMQVVVLGALVLRATARVWRVGIASIILASLYTISLVVAYRFAHLPTSGVLSSP